MPDEFAYDVFLNHSVKDTAVMRELAEGLKKDGVKVWFEEWEVKGRDAKDAAKRQAKRSEGMEKSRVMVLGLSANACGDEWERLEWERLEAETRRFRDPVETQRRFVPLRLDDAPRKGSMAALLGLAARKPGAGPHKTKGDLLSFGEESRASEE